MQTIAAELGLSETVFVLGGSDRLRIFTPAAELPLAGHPVVGATLDLARIGRIRADAPHVFKTGMGDTPVEMDGDVARMTQAPLAVGTAFGVPEIAAALHLAPGDLVGTPRVYSTSGVQQLFARV